MDNKKIRRPPRCEACGEELETISMPEDENPYFKWDGEKYILSYEGTAHMACPGCGYDLTSQFTFTTPDDFNPDEYADPFLDKHGVKRCCRYCTHYDPNNYGQYDEILEKGDEGVCLEEGMPYPREHPDKPLSPELCNAFKLHEKLRAVLDEVTIDDTGGLDIPPDVEARITQA